MYFNRLSWSAAALVALAPAIHVAPAAAVEGYVTTRYDHQPLRDGYGGCVHDYEWQPGMRFADCEPEPVVAAAPQPENALQPEQEPPLAEAPPHAPLPVARPVPFRLSVDALFDFDSATLKPEGRAALDALAGELASSTYDSVAIVGHADRIGATKYNQSLSERRARVLRDYLASKGIDAQKISSSGVGSSQPVTLGQCDHLRGARLLACLQPDRYAEVTVAGTAVQVSAAPE